MTRTIKYHCVEPEVAGGWGKNTAFTRTPGKPTVVHKLHYEFNGWLGDELLESTPCFIVSERLAREIEGAKLTGVKLDQVEVSTSSEFQDKYPDRQLPKLVWLKVEGNPSHDDFGITQKLQLVVSERALGVLRPFISHALVSELA